MAWRDNLIQASFRGVDFFVSSHDYSVGRRTQISQYPFKDKPYTNDLGLDIDEFLIEAYIIANQTNNQDYFQQRDALITAIKKSGPGKLVHPYLGEHSVVLSARARVRESFIDGGMVRFTLSFVKAGDTKDLSSSIEPITLVDESAEDAIDTTLDSFYDQYTVENEPGWSISRMTDDFSEFINMGKGQISKLRNAGGSSIETVKSTFDDARNTMIEYVRYPCQIGNAAVDAMNSVLETANIVGSGYLGRIIGQCSERILTERLSVTGDIVNQILGRSMIDSLIGISGKSFSTGFGAETSLSTDLGSLVDISVTTEARARQAANRLAFINMIKAVSIVTSARIAIRTDYDSFQDSQEDQDKIADSIDYFLSKLGDESASDPFSDFGIYTDNRNLYDSISDLRATLVKAMRVNALALPNEIVFEANPLGINALQLAYDRYEDIERMDEIFFRNQPSTNHPGFMNGELKILDE